MREKFRQFMIGRYGADEFSKVCSMGVVVFLVLHLLTRWSVFLLLGFALMIYMYFRMFSRNISKRYAENQKFLAKTSKIRMRWNKEINMMKQRKVYHIYSCPGCKQKIRIPKGKGKIEIKCPKCQTTFVKKS